uniref:Uncharacterized protein n=1 Tax=Acrobeloides nanus TaxID=290746 RepID=A0A914E8E1_9BILA
MNDYKGRRSEDECKPVHKRRVPELKLFFIALIGCINVMLEVVYFTMIRVLPNGSTIKPAFLDMLPFILDCGPGSDHKKKAKKAKSAKSQEKNGGNQDNTQNQSNVNTNQQGNIQINISNNVSPTVSATNDKTNSNQAQNFGTNSNPLNLAPKPAENSIRQE